MTAHLPTVTVQIDVFPDDELAETEAVTPQWAAVRAWEDICDWVTSGYLPVVAVLMEVDGEEIVIDLERLAKEKYGR